MRNERGPKKQGRSGSSGYKSRSNSSTGSNKRGESKTKRSPKRFDNDKKDPSKSFKKTGDKKDWTDRKKTGTTARTFRKKNTDSQNEDEGRKFKSKSSYTDYKKQGRKKEFTKREDKGTEREKPFRKKTFTKDVSKKEDKGPGFKKPFAKKSFDRDSTSKDEKGLGFKKPFKKKPFEREYTRTTEIVRKKDGSKGIKKTKVFKKDQKDDDGSVRLNKYIANAGICSRREADTFIQTGVVTVNGVVITELGYKVKPGDQVVFGGKPIIGEKPVYILLNKPKDYITTSKDPQNRKTIYDLISGVKERVFPVGRLDRNTTGVLLLTNDGHMADKLMHPRKSVAKIYHAELDKKFTAPDMESIRKGIELEDGFFKPDVVEYVEGMDKHHVGLEIHSGKNRIVRRLFEAMEYKVVKLDRVVFANLTKKGLTRGKWRFLQDNEIHMLKML